MYDRAALLAAVDLAALADELLGQSRGTGRAARWACPNPDHPQTGRTPPVTISVNHSGEQHWHCHGCGCGGSALDLIARVHHTDLRGAFDHLAARVGHSPVAPGTPVRRTERPPRAPVKEPEPQPIPPALARYVDECAHRLWEPAATEIHDWLTDTRGLPADVLRHNRVGADTGPRQGRPWGLAVADGGAAVVPIQLGGADTVYVQLRLLHPSEGRDRFLNPTSRLARNPRVGLILPVQRAHPEVIVTEGPIDALSAASAGYCAAAVLGAAYVHNPVTAAILSRIPAPLVLGFDPDHAGQLASRRLPELLAAHGCAARLLPLEHGDLNDHHRLAGNWPADLTERVHAAVPSPASERAADLSAAVSLQPDGLTDRTHVCHALS